MQLAILDHICRAQASIDLFIISIGPKQDVEDGFWELKYTSLSQVQT